MDESLSESGGFWGRTIALLSLWQWGFSILLLACGLWLVLSGTVVAGGNGRLLGWMLIGYAMVRLVLYRLSQSGRGRS